MQTGSTDSDGIAVRKLVLVDDEVDGADFAAALLRSHGLQVLVVHSATEALQVLQDDKEIDAVLTDVMMPGMSGLQLASSIREKYPALKIVLMSGYVLPDLLTAQEPLTYSPPNRTESIRFLSCYAVSCLAFAQVRLRTHEGV